MDLKELQTLFKTDIGSKIQQHLLESIEDMDRISENITPFNFFGSMIEILARQKAVKKLRTIIGLFKITNVKIKDVRDNWE